MTRVCEFCVGWQVTGVDICSSQIQLAAGATLTELGLDVEGVGVPRGRAIQARVNMETLMADGSVRPSGGVLSAYDPPGGPGVRVDGMGYTGVLHYKLADAFCVMVSKMKILSRQAQDTMETDRAWVSNRIRNVAIFRQVRFHSFASAGTKVNCLC